MNILNEIVGIKKEEVKKLRQKYNIGDFMSKELYHSPTISFIQRFNASQNISVIAEIKKASPSKGIIREDFNHLKIAEDYFAAGADAVSVLTDEKFFHGSINYLKDIAAIKTAPLLRKDFIIDEVQVFEAKANGADIILLISEILSADQIKELTLAAKEAGLEVLLELHNRNQFDKIDFATAKLPLDATKNNYFIESWYCSTPIQPICEFVKENYKLKLIKQTNSDLLYYFVNGD